MKRIIPISVFLVGLCLGAPQFALADEYSQEQLAEWKAASQGWSLEDHMVAAKSEEQNLQTLENRIQHLDERIANLEQKPYFDPKGIKRNALKLLEGNLKEKMHLSNERIAWHYRQADQAKLMK